MATPTAKQRPQFPEQIGEEREEIVSRGIVVSGIAGGMFGDDPGRDAANMLDALRSNHPSTHSATVEVVTVVRYVKPVGRLGDYA